MRIYIRCTEDGCGAEFGGDERYVLNQFGIHMEEHRLKAREENNRAFRAGEAIRLKVSAKLKKPVLPRA